MTAAEFDALVAEIGFLAAFRRLCESVGINTDRLDHPDDEPDA